MRYALAVLALLLASTAVENGRNDCGTFKFIQVWRKVTREISYDHEPMRIGATAPSTPKDA